MSAARVETVLTDGGLEITRLITSDSNIVVPATVNGVDVVSLGRQFLRDCHGSSSRTLVIPASVVRASEEALVSLSGLRMINYLGSFEVFNKFKWSISTDCQVTCADGFTFNFLAGYSICFPQFDNEILITRQRMSEQIAMERLSNPIMLTDDNREMYIQYMRSRIIPMAEHAIMENDINALHSTLDSDLIPEKDLMGLLEYSLRSGKTSATSVLMSKMNAKVVKQ
jgi:hypothetical protein